MLKSLIFLLIFTETITIAHITNGEQKAHPQNARFELNVKGKLTCAEYPAVTVRVRLWKNNERSVLDEVYVDKSGNFELSASTFEREYNPIVAIYHDCNDGVKPGQRKLKFEIPKHYITFWADDKKVFDLGSFNLETVMKYNEERQDYVDKRKRRRRNLHKSPKSNDLKKLDEEEKSKEQHLNKSKTKKHHRRCAKCQMSRQDLLLEAEAHNKTTNVFKGRDEEIDERNSEW